MIQQKKNVSANSPLSTAPRLLLTTLLLSLLFLLFFFLLVSCTPSQKQLPMDLQASCCQECLAASQRDPSGYDISIKPCAQYELSESCKTFFAEKNLLVMNCQEAS